MHEVPATVDPMMIRVCAFDSWSTLALPDADNVVAVGPTEELLIPDDGGGRQPSIE